MQPIFIATRCETVQPLRSASLSQAGPLSPTARNPLRDFQTQKAASPWGHDPTLIKVARCRTKHNQRSGRAFPAARSEDRLGGLMVVSSPLCTVPSACASTSCGEPRGLSGICGLRVAGIAPSLRRRGIGPTRRPRKHQRRRRWRTSLPARDPSRSRSAPVVVTKATLIGQMG